MSAPPAIGALRHRAELQAPQDSPDDAGGLSRTYKTIGTVYAELRTLSGEAQFIEQRAEQSLACIARFRWRKDVTSDMRLVVRERTLRILACYDEDGRKRVLNCRCEEIRP
jgi:SPP1 family predicted phage head-tail adaptor